MPFLRFATALSLAFVLCGAASAEPLSLTAAQQAHLGVRTQRLEAGGNAAASALPARVLVPNGQLRIVAAPVAGLVESLQLAPGMAVKRGQVVARLASPQGLELQRDALQAASQSGLLQQNLKRDEQLFAEGLIAESRLQATRAAAAQAGAMASERQQELSLAGLAPGRLGGPLALVAPIDGVILEQGVQVGQRVEASALIYRIARLKPLWLEIQAPLALAAGLREGQAVRISGSDIKAPLVAIGRAVDPASQTVLLRARVEQGAERLTPGQAVEVELAAGGAAAGLSVPASAVFRHEGQTLVFVDLGAEGDARRFAARPVRILSQGGQSLAVDGLQGGEMLVVAGVSGLKAMLAGVGRE